MLCYVLALHGPEGHISKDGQYDFHLLEKAEPPEGSNMDDENLCPSYNWYLPKKNV